jgi:hypothetical protein
MLQFAIAKINGPLFKEQLNAALGYAPPFHIAQEGGGLATITIRREDLVLGDEVLVQDVIDRHDYKQLTDVQAAALDAANRQEAAREALALADPDKVLADAAAANTLEALRLAMVDVAAMVKALVALVEGS